MRTEGIEKRVDLLYELMERQIEAYRHLLEEVKKVSTYLKPVSPESLIQSLEKIREETDTLRDLGKRTEGLIGQILQDLGRRNGELSLSSLLAVLPPVHHRRIRLYQKTLTRLKRWVTQVNERNRAFVVESLDLVRGFLSLLLDPLKGSPVYSKNGQTRSVALSSCSLDRRVE